MEEERILGRAQGLVELKITIVINLQKLQVYFKYIYLWMDLVQHIVLVYLSNLL
jgi:hypothetical protein